MLHLLHAAGHFTKRPPLKLLNTQMSSTTSVHRHVYLCCVRTCHVLFDLAMVAHIVTSAGCVTSTTTFMPCRSRFNEDCEDCEGSVRGTTTLTITGGTYATLAFSMHPGVQQHAPAGDACELSVSLLNLINNNFERRFTQEDLALNMRATQHSLRQATLGASFADAWGAIIAAVFDSPLPQQLQTVIGNNANNRGSLRTKMSSGNTREGMYAGIGFVHMGEATIVDAAGDIQSGAVRPNPSGIVLPHLYFTTQHESMCCTTFQPTFKA